MIAAENPARRAAPPRSMAQWPCVRDPTEPISVHHVAVSAGRRLAAQLNARPLEYGPPVALVDAKRDAHDGVVLRSDDHGAHDEYLRIGQDANRTNQPGNSQEDEEAGRVDGIRADLGFHHIPHGSNVPLD